MNGIDIRALIERARANAAHTGASTPNEGTLDSLLDEVPEKDAAEVRRLSAELNTWTEEEEKDEALQKRAAVERARNFATAKLLMAVDVLTEAMQR